MNSHSRNLNRKGVVLLQSGAHSDAISSFKAAFDVVSNNIGLPTNSKSNNNKPDRFSLKWVKISASFNIYSYRSHSPLDVATRRNRTTSRPAPQPLQEHDEQGFQHYYHQGVAEEGLIQNVSFRSRPTSPNLETAQVDSSDTSSKKQSNHSRSFVYKRALNMDESFGTRATQEAAIILFNLALASHLLALTGGPGKTKLLKMALTVYGRASNFLRADMDGDEAYSKKTTAFHVVALNNVGQIYHELGQFKSARSCFRHVSAALDTMEDRDAIDGRERDGILLNIMTLKQPVLAAAA